MYWNLFHEGFCRTILVILHIASRFFYLLFLGGDSMWHSYFFGLQKKYNMRVSKNKPLVIRLDGQNVTKDKTINLIDDYNESFYKAICDAAWYFSKKYNCYSIFGSDEISFIFPNPQDLIEEYSPDEKSDYSNEITSLFSQYFFDYFNNMYKDRKIFWHAKSFSIPSGKINSYVKYRSNIIENVLTTYFLIRNSSYESNVKLEGNRKKCMKINGFSSLNNRINGELYYCGKKIDLEKFIKNNEIVEYEKDEDNGEIVIDIEI